jgi:hypothetical protein
MPHDALIDYLPLWGLFAATVVAVLLSLEGGFRLGRWRHQRSEQEKDVSVSAMVGATLGLLAFLLAFTFGMVASRFEVRRQVLLDEVNAIGTAYLRAALLPEPHRTEIRNLLRHYADVRLEGVRSGKVEEAIQRSEELHGRLWSQAAAVGEKNPGSIVAGLFIQSLNEVIDLHTKRVTAGLRSRLPDMIWLVLYAITVLGMGAMGYQAGLSGGSRSLAGSALALAFSAVILLIADLDRPREGLLKVSQQPMVDLQESMRERSP